MDSAEYSVVAFSPRQFRVTMDLSDARASYDVGLGAHALWVQHQDWVLVWLYRLLIADNSGGELWEIDLDWSDTHGQLCYRDLPTTLTLPAGMTVLGGRLLIADGAGREL